MREPPTTALLLGYYESFLQDRDLDGFARQVSVRYDAGTLARLVESGGVPTRRAAVLALGLCGTFEQNAAVAAGLRDDDAMVRGLAENALWSIWFRASSPEHNATLQQVRDLIRQDRLDQAINLSTRLIADAPAFAEAYNQRAIAHFFQGAFAESAADCRRALERNPYHIGAISGLAQCQLRMEQPGEALKSLRLRPATATPQRGPQAGRRRARSRWTMNLCINGLRLNNFRQFGALWCGLPARQSEAGWKPAPQELESW